MSTPETTKVVEQLFLQILIEADNNNQNYVDEPVNQEILKMHLTKILADVRW